MEKKVIPPDDIFGILRYTRAQALADGALVDVTGTAQEAGFRLPVALTAAAWAAVVNWSDEDTQRQAGQDEGGRLWDALWMARMAMLRVSDSTSTAYQLHHVPRGGSGTQTHMTTLKVVIAGGDDGGAVLTIMLSNED